MSGTYRSVIAKVEIHNYEIMNYEDSSLDLISCFYIEGEKCNHEGKGTNCALAINFSLKTSCYPTIFLRELTKGKLIDMSKEVNDEK